MKILFLINDLNFFCSHRLPIARELQLKGFEVKIAYGDHGGFKSSILEEQGFETFYVPIERSGMNLLKEFKSILLIFKLFLLVKPDLVHLVTIKPYLYGGIVARLVRVPSLVSAVSGLGTLFIHKNFKSKILRTFLYPLYYFAFSHPNQSVIVQNKEDANLLMNWGVLKKNKIKLIRGSGVKIEEFVDLEETNTIPVVCFLARLLVDKGVYEFIAAAKILKKRGINAKFILAGDIDPKNKSGLNKNDITKIKKGNHVQVIGYQKDVPKLYASSHIICLPSYREGLPKSLIEAAAAGRAVVTSDVPGCRDAIESGKTGLLVPVKDEEALANAINYLIENPDIRKQMGRAGRKLAEREFKLEGVIKNHISIYKKLFEN